MRRKQRRKSCPVVDHKNGRRGWLLEDLFEAKPRFWPLATKSAKRFRNPIGMKPSATTRALENRLPQPPAMRGPQAGLGKSKRKLASPRTTLKQHWLRRIAATKTGLGVSSSCALQEKPQRKSWRVSGDAYKMTNRRNFGKRQKSSAGSRICG